MSNTFDAIVRLTHDVEELTLGERSCKKLRVVDNTFGKNNQPLFFDVIVSSTPDMAVAEKLVKGNKIAVVGQLVKGEYTAKKTTKYAKKGTKVVTFSMPFGRIKEVVQSPTFFGNEETSETEETNEPEGSTEEPGYDEGSEAPMEGVV